MNEKYCEVCGLMFVVGNYKSLECWGPNDINAASSGHDVTKDHQYIWNGGSFFGGSGGSMTPHHVIYPGSGTMIHGKNFVINLHQMRPNQKDALKELWLYLENNKVTTNITICGEVPDFITAGISANPHVNRSVKTKANIKGMVHHEFLVLKKLGFTVRLIKINLGTNLQETSTVI